VESYGYLGYVLASIVEDDSDDKTRVSVQSTLFEKHGRIVNRIAMLQVNLLASILRRAKKTHYF